MPELRKNSPSDFTLAARDVRRTASVVGRLPRSAFYTSEVWVHPDGNHAYLGTTFAITANLSRGRR